MFSFSLMLFAGLVILAISGDRLVRGSVSAAMKLGVSQVLASVVIVGFGTSAPEMLVAIDATMSGAPGMAMGNIIGSNIANILLVLGLPALFFTLKPNGRGLRRSIIVTVFATAAWLILTPIYGLSPIIGVAFLCTLLAYIFSALVWADSPATEQLADDDIVHEAPVNPILTAGYICIGIVGLPLGAHLTITGATGIAELLNFRGELVGLTLIALGTSLPELAAAMAAVYRKEPDVIFGDVAGSNLFNLLGAGGIISLFGHFELPAIFNQFDHWFMGGTLLFLMIYIFCRRQIGWLTGSCFLAIYVLYLLGLYYFYVLGLNWSVLWTQIS
ncbi:sodium:calcium antiporter [Ponticaulis profundi]|uniref:Sodium:calcium antiporter n=1 Tax=Ponticaulis profundi TaxID=2665222 RepID=A0ABW1SB50_9PROT